MKKILLVGCGNIGYRHLQSLLQSDTFLITIVEPNETAKKNAELLLSQTNAKFENLKWVSNISELTESYDFTIIATQSSNRQQLITQLLETGNRRFLIEKMVCQSTPEYEKILNDFTKFNAKGWVNTNFRYFTFFQNLITYFSKNMPLKFVISGFEKGLGSNAIHFLDLFLWFTNSKNLILNGDDLTDKLLPNKRNPNLVEFSGTITGKNNGSLISISFLPSFKNSIIIEISNSEHHILIDTTESTVSKLKGLESFSQNFKFQHTSELTKKIVDDVIKYDTCDLPTLNDLFAAHSELFRIFNSHIKKLKNVESDICPIT